MSRHASIFFLKKKAGYFWTEIDVTTCLAIILWCCLFTIQISRIIKHWHMNASTCSLVTTHTHSNKKSYKNYNNYSYFFFKKRARIQEKRTKPDTFEKVTIPNYILLQQRKAAGQKGILPSDTNFMPIGDRVVPVKILVARAQIGKARTVNNLHGDLAQEECLIVSIHYKNCNPHFYAFQTSLQCQKHSNRFLNIATLMKKIRKKKEKNLQHENRFPHKT